jgi:hypothetical protein
LRVYAIGRGLEATDFGKLKQSRGDVLQVDVGLYVSSTEGGEVKFGAARIRFTPGQSFAQRVLEKRSKYGAIQNLPSP